MHFLPISKDEFEGQLDFVYVSGDAYVDHPSFGVAIITRMLENKGFSVGIIAQPDWKSCEDFKRLGKPRLGFLVSSGNIDSMVNHYTAAKKRRSEDYYSPGGKAGCRPDRAVIVYCNRIREAFGDVTIIIGGLEASLRRFAHYDYWDNRVRRSILLDSRADILSYGMGERSIVEVAEKLRDGEDFRNARGICYVSKTPQGTELADFESVRDDKIKYAEMTRVMFSGTEALSQRHMDRFVIQNPPAEILSRRELDKVYSLPYMRDYHPSYAEGVPAVNEVKFSITATRGCFGGCSFCSLHFHQGREVVSRSEKSILVEAEKITHDKDFKGYIHDVGGPTANFRQMPCGKEKVCKNRYCLWPEKCSNLRVDHSEFLGLLRKIRKISGVKKVFIRSGIRYDYLTYDEDETFFKELCEHHVSGQLKVAPEHVSDNVLGCMGKPGVKIYNKFVDRFNKYRQNQFLVPYLMSSHPGSTLQDAIKLAEYLRDNRIRPEQVQDFYPTPGTISTCMYWTGIDPRSMKKVYVAQSYEEKSMQRALLQYSRRENYKLARKALLSAGRQDLIGDGAKCLVRGEMKNGKDFRRKSSKPTNKK